MDKFSYALGLGIGQNLKAMGVSSNLNLDEFAHAIKDIFEGNNTAISHDEAREIVNNFFQEFPK